MIPSIHIGRAISRVRRLKGIGQKVLADEFGVTGATISRMEHKAMPRPQEIERCAKVLGVSINTILLYAMFQKDFPANCQPLLKELKELVLQPKHFKS